MTYRILVTGSREWDDYELLRDTIRVAAAAIASRTSADIVVVHGNYGNADHLAARAALELGFEPEPHPADWQAYGTAAGPIRNTGMVAAGADLCLAFTKRGALNRGTADCMGRAIAADIPTVRIER